MCSQINEDVGYWRAFGFGIVAMYKSDLQSVGGLDTSILGWGGEDVDLYEKVEFSMYSKMFRSLNGSYAKILIDSILLYYVKIKQHDNSY